MMPISMDIETSGLNKVKCGIWQIGAIDLNNPKEYFLQEGRIDAEDIIEEKALLVIGKTKEELRDSQKQSQKQLLENFFQWVKERPMKNFLCQNPKNFDVPFLEIRAIKYGLKMPFHYRAFNLHDYAQKKYHDLHGEFLVKEDHSDMGLTKIIELCGMKDNRQAHNALEDAKLTGECFYRLLKGKNLFPEYAEFEIPEVLKK